MTMTRFSVSLLSAFLLFGCGTIMQGTTQDIGISSTPSQATIKVNGQQMGTTPAVLDLKRKSTHFIQIELDGYQLFETTLTRKTSGWVWGNLVFGGLPGLVVDAAAGGMYKLTPDQITADMRLASSMAPGNDIMMIAVVLKANPDWEKIGQLEKVR
ncbi:MAG: PEGA domain-containing protein [Rhodothermales bacterium]